jgi:hypothetical protein
MVYQSFQQTWKPLQPKAVEPTLQPKHFVVASALPPAIDKPLVPAASVKEEIQVSAPPTKTIVVEETIAAPSCSCAARPWFTSPWLSLGLGIGFVMMLMWAVSTRIENAWLMKQHTQLMFNLIETLRL